MTGFKELDPQQRQRNVAANKKAQVEKMRAASKGPAAEERDKARKAVNDERLVRRAEREKAKESLKAEQNAADARAAALAAQVERDAIAEKDRLAREESEREAALLIEQKAARDARYAARKTAKTVRRRGY
jgi:hypothetical protein